MNIALLGPSGAGKGTQAAHLCVRFDLTHLSTGDILRDNLENRTALGILARKYMERGELVPDEVVEAMMEERLEAIPRAQGLLFDGFPRTPEQAAFLDELFRRTGRKLDVAIYLIAEEKDVLARLGGRLVCTLCHAAYHSSSRPPQVADVCDLCEGELKARQDDNADMARTRLRVFQRHIGPILEYYQPGGRLHLVSGSGSVETVREALVRLIEACGRNEARPATREEIQLLQPARPVAPAAPTARKLALNLVLLGGPGSGKGTQAENLMRDYKLCHIASGDLFRENLAQETRLGQLAKTYMNRGELVPDDITEAMVEERLARPDTEAGFLLDGFPRTLPQAEALTDMLVKLNRPLAGVLHLCVTDASLIERLSGRFICRTCQTPFHLTFKPPLRAGICDKCGGELYQREDDQPDTVRARLKTFHKQTEPLIGYYRQHGLLADIDGEGDVPTVSQRTLMVVEKMNARLRTPVAAGTNR